MDEPNFHLLDYVSVLKRRAWWLVVPIVVAIVAGIALAKLLPRAYRSQATLVVTSPGVSPDLVRYTPLDFEERVRAITHELLSRPVLEQVVREEAAANTGTLESAIADLRSRTTVTIPRRIVESSSKTGPDSFVVSHAASSPEAAQRITSALSRAFVEQHSHAREARAEGTAEFLAGQLRLSKERLDISEERLRQAKEVYMGRLPEQMQANLQIVSGLRAQLAATATSLRGELDRLSVIERQIEGMQQGSGEMPTPAGGPVQGREQRVATLERQLADATAIYTERHPEIQRLNADLATARAELAAERQRPAAERMPQLTLSPAYRELLADREAVRLRIRDLQRAETRAQADISQYQARVEATPRIEQQLLSLNREYELGKQQYKQLSEKHEAALLAGELERQGASEQFAVLYPASLPSRPFTPNVPRVLIFAVLAGLVVGGASALGREYLDRAVYDVRTLQQEFQVPVLAEIPRISEA